MKKIVELRYKGNRLEIRFKQFLFSSWTDKQYLKVSINLYSDRKHDGYEEYSELISWMKFEMNPTTGEVVWGVSGDNNPIFIELARKEFKKLLDDANCVNSAVEDKS